MPPLYVQKIGEAARRLLTPSLRGKVLAVVTDAVYLLSDQDELFWLTTETFPMHHRCLRLSGTLPRLAVDAPFHVEDRHLLVASLGCLDFSQASIWESPLISSGDVLMIANLAECVRLAFSTFDDLPSPTGFGSLIPNIVITAQNHKTSCSPQIPSTIPALAWPAIQEIAKACLVHNFPKIMEQVDSLIGLGEGLTPSGDDFTGGLLFCIYHLQRLYPALLMFFDSAAIVDRSRLRTNPISYTMLKDLADGHGVEPLHQLMGCILNGRSIENITRQISHLIQIGHSTGWDLLTGLLTGLLLTSHSSIHSAEGANPSVLKVEDSIIA